MFRWKTLLCLLMIFLPSLPAQAREVGGTIRKDVRWEGTVTLRQAVTIEPGAVLTLAPGTHIRAERGDAVLTVRGSLKAVGTSENPVVFAGGADWKGIEFFETPSGNTFEHVRFEGGETGISAIASSFTVRHVTFRNTAAAIKLLRDSQTRVEHSAFWGGRIAVDSQMKSRAEIRDSRFSGYTETAVVATHGSSGPIEGNLFEKNKQGVALIQKFPEPVTGNTFRENGIALFCSQTQGTPILRGNLFEKNENALVNFSFAYPLVEANRFLNNKTAVRNDQFGSPKVVHNLFRGNGAALFNYRKSDPQVEKNVFDGNDLALFCDFSSYPRVKENHFVGNRMAVKLGIHQSADFEKRTGSRSIMQKNAADRSSQNPLLPRTPNAFRDVVDVSENWWGTDTPLLARAGKEGNLPFFHDRLDQPEVTYEGFGTTRYRLDRIVFAPWLQREVPNAGPPPHR